MGPLVQSTSRVPEFGVKVKVRVETHKIGLVAVFKNLQGQVLIVLKIPTCHTIQHFDQWSDQCTVKQGQTKSILIKTDLFRLFKMSSNFVENINK